MKLDPKLLKRLEERPDANSVLAEALGVCPTCGQAMNGLQQQPRQHGPPIPKRQLLKDQIIEYLTQDTSYGNQTRCARALGIQLTYVNKVWRDHQKAPDRPRTRKRDAIIEWMAKNPERTQGDCARTFGVTRSYVSQVMQRVNGGSGKDDQTGRTEG